MRWQHEMARCRPPDKLGVIPVPPSTIAAVLADIDSANAADPRRDLVAGVERPRELVYAERMSERLSQLYPNASDELRIAARAQHICRWQVPRASYPIGREGYNSWRTACRVHHADVTAAILRRHGTAEAVIAKVGKIICKHELKSDADSQALENVAAIVFVQFYFDAFLAEHRDYNEDKIVTILSKTLRKMDGTGHAAVLALSHSPQASRLIMRATAPRQGTTAGGGAVV